MFMMYFIGQYWFIIVEIGCMFAGKYESHDEFSGSDNESELAKFK
jgi:hypothetical protein